MVYTDIDSYVIHADTENIIWWCGRVSWLYGFSDYDKNHQKYDITNKKS